eukprot:Clim_evm49s225 gene=Clim_evmTU49s225
MSVKAMMTRISTRSSTGPIDTGFGLRQSAKLPWTIDGLHAYYQKREEVLTLPEAYLLLISRSDSSGQIMEDKRGLFFAVLMELVLDGHLEYGISRVMVDEAKARARENEEKMQLQDEYGMMSRDSAASQSTRGSLDTQGTVSEATDCGYTPKAVAEPSLLQYRIRALHKIPTGVEILDEAVNHVARLKNPHTFAGWVDHFSTRGDGIGVRIRDPHYKTARSLREKHIITRYQRTITRSRIEYDESVRESLVQQMSLLVHAPEKIDCAGDDRIRLEFLLCIAKYNDLLYVELTGNDKKGKAAFDASVDNLVQKHELCRIMNHSLEYLKFTRKSERFLPGAGLIREFAW